MELLTYLTFVLKTWISQNSVLSVIFLLFIEESGIPLPIPGDAVLTYLGYAISRGAIGYWSAFSLVLAAVMGGSSILFYLAQKYGQSIVLRFGHLLHVSDAKLLYVEHKFKKYGAWVIIMGRHVPGLRIPITIFSGISGVTFRTFFWSTLLSVILWIPMYLEVGRRLGARAAHLFHTHQNFYILALAPLCVFIFSLITAHTKHTKKLRTQADGSVVQKN